MYQNDNETSSYVAVHPVLTRRELIQQIQSGAEKEYVLFWRHEGPVANVSYFSQWCPAPFVVDGETYKTAEHFMMAEKARIFGDDEVRQQIMQAETPPEAMALGRRVRGFQQEIWRQHRTDVVVNGNLAKFKQNDDMLDVLLGTGTSVIVEASPSDSIWGIRMGEKHPNARDPERWGGENLLGFCLMRVRDVLANEASRTDS